MAVAWRAILIVETLLVIVGRLLWLWLLLMLVLRGSRTPLRVLAGDGSRVISLGLLIWMSRGKALAIEGV